MCERHLKTRYDALTTAWSSSVAVSLHAEEQNSHEKDAKEPFQKQETVLVWLHLQQSFKSVQIQYVISCTVQLDQIGLGFNWKLCYQWDEMYLRCRAPEVLQLLSLRLVMCDETVIDSESSERGSEQVSSDSAWYTSNDKANVMIRLCTEKVLLSKNQGFKIHLVWFKTKWIWGINIF